MQESVSRARVEWGHKCPFWTFGLGMESLWQGQASSGPPPSICSVLISAASGNLQLIYDSVTAPSPVSLHGASAGSALPVQASLHNPRPLGGSQGETPDPLHNQP